MRLFPASLAAASLLALAYAVVPQSAAAQNPTFCSGVIIADSFYSSVSSNGKQTNVEYYVQLRNTSAAPQEATVQFNYGDAKHFVSRKISGSQRFAGYASLRLALGVETINNPTGAGKLADSAIKPLVRVTCANVR